MPGTDGWPTTQSLIPLIRTNSIAPPLQSLTSTDRLVLDRVDLYLSRGLLLKKWWEQTDISNAYEDKFELERTFNRPDSSYGFFGRAQVGRELLPVMGNVQTMFYDQPKVSNTARSGETAASLGQQIREFVLHYFMRVSSFRQPEAFAAGQRFASDAWTARFSACPRTSIVREGFGFSQLYYKSAATGEIGKFGDDERFRIVDLREVGPKYEWLVFKVRIFDFSLKLRPFGDEGPELVFGLDEESYLIMHPEFVVDGQPASSGVLGRYGLGYAFIKSPTRSLLAYGPGEFDAAFELIQFNVLESGTVQVRMVFVVNRPARIVNLPIAPLDWGWRAADVASLGLVSRLFAPLKVALDGLPGLGAEVDPVYAFIEVLNALTANQAAEQLCFSKEQLDKTFLLQHFMQHYQTIAGSLLTWRQIADWLDPDSLPEWVVSGRSS